jgi:toxin ParE1/3/4
MAEVRWTHQAADDLDAITSFIAADSPSYATLFAIDALAVVERLSDFPFSGRVLPELDDPAIREIIFGNYRIVYRVNGDLLELLMVYHGARLLDASRLNSDES